MHLVGFITEIYYDARPYERQTTLLYVRTYVKLLCSTYVRMSASCLSHLQAIILFQRHTKVLYIIAIRSLIEISNKTISENVCCCFRFVV